MSKEAVLRNFILDKSEDLFDRYGCGETSMDMIAVACDISKPTLYNYFKSKHELFDSLSRRVINSILERLQELLGQEKDKREILKELITSSGALLEDRKRFLRMYLRESCLMVRSDAEEDLHWYSDMRAGIVKAIEPLLADILRPEVKRKFGVTMAATMVFYILEGYLHEHVLGEQNDTTLHREFILKFLEKGVLKSPSKP
ncbi:MAG TPA: TetR/AcrR family transcriptional regulator [Acidobacteriota bacterium]